MNAYEQGQLDVYASMGISKEAALGAVGRTAARWWPGVKQFGKNVGINFKNIMVGSPYKAIDQIRAGKAFAPGGLIREGFNPGKGLMGLGMGALFYGLPAYEGYKILKSDAPNKAEQLGKVLGGTAASLGAWRAFGMLGAMGATPIGSTLGGLVGKGVGAATNKGQAAPTPARQLPRPYYTPYGLWTAHGRNQTPQRPAWGPQR